MKVSVCVHGYFTDGVARFDNDGAKRDAAWIIEPRIINGDTEKACRADGFNAGIDFFERTPDGFFTLVDAKNDLCSEAIRLWLRLW
jgi:hypothetical protein